MLGIRGDVAQKCWNKAETQANQYSDVDPLFIDYHRLAMIVPVKSAYRQVHPKLMLIPFMVGGWVGSLGKVTLDFRILGHIMLDFLSDDRTCASENKELAGARLWFICFDR
jgi:hypothetical protein